jgi:hypothetical protein
MTTMSKEQLRAELHVFVVSKLRMGYALHAVTQALIIESQKLHETADIVEAIREFDLDDGEVE